MRLRRVQEELFLNVQSDFIPKSGVSVGEEVFVGEIGNKGVVIEHPVSIDVGEKLCLEFRFSEEAFDECGVEFPRAIFDSGGDEFAGVINEACVGFKACDEFLVECLCWHGGFLLCAASRVGAERSITSFYRKLQFVSTLQGCGGEWVIFCIAHASIDFAGIVNIVHKPNSRPEIREIPFFPIRDS